MHPTKSTSENLIDLYTRIPDYAEVQHLGQSDFINTLEKLKEEFRQCRASLYNEEFCSDSEYLAEKSGDPSRSKTTDNLCYYSKYTTNSSANNNDTKYRDDMGLLSTFSGSQEKATKINNHNLTSSGLGSGTPDTKIGPDKNNDYRDIRSRGGGQYLSIKSCELHRTPYRSTSAASLTHPSRYLTVGWSGDGEFEKNEYNNTDDDEEYEDGIPEADENHWSVGSSNSDVSISKWSSSPEIYRERSKSREFFPPSNTEQRLLTRKSQNNSAPSVAFKDETEVPKATFKANPVPDHVYKPLYEFIMLKNQRRSERVREQSKRRLLAQVKPFSFCRDSNKSSHYYHRGKVHESLNNTKPLKKRRNDVGNIKTNNNRLTSASLFKAKPAPPRTKALLAAIRQKEQQDYRELKKRLRAETLLKHASLPPSMAAREKRTKLTNAKIDEVLHDYQMSFSDKKKGRHYREQSTGTDDTGILTDEDRMTEDEFAAFSTRKVTTLVRPFKFSQRSPRRFTSFGTSRHSAAAAGVFEASSNDNHASRLRYQAAKVKEQVRMQREEEELLRIMSAERRRQKLRDNHLHAWQHACSYSAEQDIAMRRQLRQAASILERESFVRDMSCMLSRVRSAPLLLEGGHRLERKQEPCRKHRDEFQKTTSSNPDRPWNKLSTPRLYSSNNWINSKKKAFPSSADRFGAADEKSETLALAEGSLSNSDNESEQADDDDDDDPAGLTDDSGSDLERDGNMRAGVAKGRKSGEEDLRADSSEREMRQGRSGSNNHANEGGKDDHVLSTDDDINDDAEIANDKEEGRNNQ